ncbi:MAG: hypothetical protein LBV29_03710 [Azoarcus sp.]|nr:hypothetical protein [Azoarcus sp.]
MAVLVDAELIYPVDGYRFVETLRTYGYGGAAFVVADDEPALADRAQARQSGATDVLAFGGSGMLRALRTLAFTGSESANVGIRGRASGGFPPWLPIVVKHLGQGIGPAAGQFVRDLFIEMRAKRDRPPHADEVILAAAETLNNWPTDKLRFVAAACHGGALGWV